MGLCGSAAAGAAVGGRGPGLWPLTLLASSRPRSVRRRLDLRHLPDCDRARRRHLRSVAGRGGGVLLPSADELWDEGVAGHARPAALALDWLVGTARRQAGRAA